MRLPLYITLLLALGGAAHAQNDTAPELPKDFAFNFNAHSSNKDGKAVTNSEFGYSRLFRDGSAMVFDETIAGPNGVLKTDKIVFIDKDGAELGKLVSDFTDEGKLKSQTLSAKDKPAQTLNWYQTKIQSPAIEVSGSILQVNYSLQKGFFKQRVIKLTLPDQICFLTVDYDEKGRRTSDKTKQPKSEMSIDYSYGPMGMSGFVSKSDDSNALKVAEISYDPKGLLDNLVFKEGGIIQSRMTMLNNPDGSSQGQRIETYTDGILNYSMTTDLTAKAGIEDEYDATGKSIIKRKAYAMGHAQTLLYEEHWSAGKVVLRTEYDLEGKVTSVTKYKVDGTIEWRETFNIPAPTAK